MEGNSVRPKDEVQEGGEDGVGAKGLRKPEEPTADEVRTHMLTHVPFRSWCPHCVRGRGISDQHKRTKEKEDRGLPVVHMDYAFFRRKVGGRVAPTVVSKERKSGALAAHVVPYKGGNHDATVEQCVLDLKRW